MAAPNIVVIQADQLAAQALGAYGDAVALTPHMDALAAEGAVFDRAYCATPLCAPSRASMMTGMLPSELGCFDNGDDFLASAPTFAHRLRAAGYHTALVGRMHFIGPDQHHGFEERLTTDVYPAGLDMVPDWDRPLENRLQWYHDADPVFAAGASRASVQQDFDDEVVFRTLRHLNDRVRANRAGEDPRPFLLVTSFIHPHDPYEPPRKHWDRFEHRSIPAPAHPQVPDAHQDPHSHRLRTMCGFDAQDPDPDQARHARRAYYAAVSYIDDLVGQIRARIESLGLAENTVIVLTSDHGDMLGEKGLWYKMSPYEQSARVPLILWGPESLIPTGRYANPVSLIDLASTLVELAGVDDGPDVGGVSLLQSVRREKEGAPASDRDITVEYLAEGTYRPQITLVRGPYKFVVCPGDPDQLFDLDTDPDELVNCAAQGEYADIVSSMSQAIEGRYDLEALEEDVKASQRRRLFVADALRQGKTRDWDLNPDAEHRYVRGDFWGALRYGTIPDDRGADGRAAMSQNAPPGSAVTSVPQDRDTR